MSNARIGVVGGRLGSDKSEKLLTDSLIHYDSDEVKVNMVHIENLRDYLKKYDEVTGESRR